jgi:thioredoxin-like negative regulator of GroEL
MSLRANEGLKSPMAKESYQEFLKIKRMADPLAADARRRVQSL